MSEALAVEPQSEPAEPQKPRKRYSGSFLALCRAEMGQETTHGPGRPSKLSAETIQAICKAVGNGVPYQTAAVAAGISGFTASRWIEKGKRDLDEGKRSNYVVFLELLKDAAAKGHALLANEVASNPDWRAKAFVLERRYPEIWGKKEQAQNVTNVVISDNLACQLIDAMKVATNGSVTIDVTPSSLPELSAPPPPDSGKLPPK